MNGMVLPLASALAAGQTASEQQFALRLQDRQETAGAAQIGELLAGYADQDAKTQTTVNDLQASLQAVQAAILAQTLLVQAVQTALDANREEEKTTGQQQRQELAGAVAAADKALRNEITRLKTRLDGWISEATGSAGGLLGAAPQRRSEQLPAGWPQATGDIKLSCNCPGRPGTWLECNGREVLRESYPNLAFVIGNTWGTPSAPERVKLPAKNQLTSVTLLLNATNVQFWIRT